MTSSSIPCRRSYSLYAPRTTANSSYTFYTLNDSHDEFVVSSLHPIRNCSCSHDGDGGHLPFLLLSIHPLTDRCISECMFSCVCFCNLIKLQDVAHLGYLLESVPLDQCFVSVSAFRLHVLWP